MALSLELKHKGELAGRAERSGGPGGRIWIFFQGETVKGVKQREWHNND